MLQDWVTTLCRELDIDSADPDVSEILDLARDAAHIVARPAAPITTFIAGYAAGLRGGGRAAVADMMRVVAAALADEQARGAHEAPGDPAPAGTGQE